MTLLTSAGRKLGLDRAAMLHAAQLAFAAWAAFTIAAMFHVQNAYWAAMPVWVVAQPTRGLLLERALFRIVGTLLGVGVGFLLLRLTHQPYLHLAGFAVWIALCSALIHVLRGVHSYGALMAGITAAIIILPSVLDPHHTLDRAIARVECTLIGVLVVTLVTGFFTPASGRHEFYRQVRRLAADAVEFAAHAIRGESELKEEQRILSEIGRLEATASLVSAGSLAGYRRLHHVESLVGASLETMAAGITLGDRKEEKAPDTPPNLPAALEGLALHLRTDVHEDSPWPDLGTIASPRMREALKQLQRAEHVLFREPAEADVKSFGRKAVYLAPHHDWVLARRMALVCGLTAFLAACIGLAAGQRAGLMTALGITIFSMILSSAPLPQTLAPKLLTGIFAGVLTAVGYRLAIQPQVTTMTDLVFSILPFMIVGSLARASPVTAIVGLEANMCFMFLSQAGMPAATPATIFTDAGCILLGATLVAGGFMLVPRQPVTQAKSAAAAICRALSRLLTQPEAHWQPQMTRQILLVTSHLALGGESGGSAPRSLLSALNLGHAITGLQQIVTNSPKDAAVCHEARAALSDLQGFIADPLNTSQKLEARAKSSHHPEVSRILMDAASALKNGAELFQFGTRWQKD